VRFGVFELKQVQISLGLIEVETINAVVVASEGNLYFRVFAGNFMVILEIQQSEVVVANSSAGRFQVSECLVDELIRDAPAYALWNKS
jgi:hypothetical protein